MIEWSSLWLMASLRASYPSYIGSSQAARFAPSMCFSIRSCSRGSDSLLKGNHASFDLENITIYSALELFFQQSAPGSICFDDDIWQM